jgi:hypothetical protein
VDGELLEELGGANETITVCIPILLVLESVIEVLPAGVIAALLSYRAGTPLAVRIVAPVLAVGLSPLAHEPIIVQQLSAIVVRLVAIVVPVALVFVAVASIPPV